MEVVKERTLSIIKPDGVQRGLVGEIIGRLEKAGFRIVAMKMVRLTKEQAERFYAVHRDRPFFRGLTEFMTSGPSVVMALEGENVISRYRDMMGATEPAQAAEGTIRRAFATDGRKNVVHGSDGLESAAFEMGFFFGEMEAGKN
jgi:nucleoside-diphosphate kinase